jgi:transcriptional regulator with XRE-family HTH domain
MIPMACESACMPTLHHDRDKYATTNVMIFEGQITDVMTLAERMKQAREKSGLTQTELAKKVGVSQGTIANLESGFRKQPRNLLALARALNVDADWLDGGKASYRSPELTNPPLAAEPSPLSEWPFETVRPDQWKLIPKHKRDVIEEQIRAMVATAASKLAA